MKPLVNRLIERLNTYGDFEEAIKAIRKNSYGPTYLVGGKIYRTLSEIIHGEDCKAAKADWDALVMGEVKLTYVPNGWGISEVYDKTTKKNSLGLQSRRKSKALRARIRMGYRPGTRYVPKRPPLHKIDLIGIKDIPGDGSLQSYFDCVPLDIQAIALCLDTQRIHGVKAMEAINKKNIKVNSTKGALPGLEIKSYIAHKAASMSYNYEGQVIQKTPCNCFEGDSKLLFDYGCKLPDFHS
jgi:hypothetical protein